MVTKRSKRPQKRKPQSKVSTKPPTYVGGLFLDFLVIFWHNIQTQLFTSNKNKIAGSVPVLMALVGNFFISLMKLAGFFISGSSVLFSEAIHSFADTANQTLLLIGIRRSTKAPNEEFSYGFGRERFLWALISACGIFFIGAGVTIYSGVDSLIHEEHVSIKPIIFIILIVSFIIESFTFLVALKELRGVSKKWNISKIIKDGDPATLAVLYEDGIAVLGVIVALTSITLTYLTGQFYWDAIGSIIIGLMLALVAVILIDKNRKFLIEKSIPDEIKNQIIEALESEPAIEKVMDFKSSILDVGIFRIKCEVEFNGAALLKEMYKKKVLREEYESIKDDYDEFMRFFAENVDRIPRVMGKKIDEIEKNIQKKFPAIKHLDIEIN